MYIMWDIGYTLLMLINVTISCELSPTEAIQMKNKN